MPLTSDSDLKDQILHNLAEYSDSGEVPHYDSDFIVGFAEAQLPIYYNEIIEEWTDLPATHRDTWRDYGMASEDNATIYSLMTIDLYNYYSDRTSEILNEIRQEQDNA